MPVARQFFVRFSGCNLWSGKEEDRHEAVCTFCDTDFVGTDGPNGGQYADPTQLAELTTHLLLRFGPNVFTPNCVHRGRAAASVG